MYTTETVTTDITETHKFCDVCGKEIPIGLRCSSIQCSQCKRDLCENCIGHEDYTMGDSRYGYCEYCWDIGQSYLSSIKLLSDQIDEEHTRWHQKCLEHLNNNGSDINGQQI